MKQPLLERLMYITLLLVFIGVGIAIYMAVEFGNKLDGQVKELKNLSKKQAQTIEQLKSGIEEIKADNKRNTDLITQKNERIECLIDIHALGIGSSEDCPEAAEVTSGSQAIPPPASPPTAAPSASPQTHRNQGQEQSTLRRFINEINNLVGKKNK